MLLRVVNFWQIWLELEAVIRVSKINGRLLKRGSAVAFSVPGRLLLVLVRCVLRKKSFLSDGRKGAAAPRKGRVCPVYLH